VPRPRPAVPVDPRAGAAPVSRPIWAPRPPIKSARQHTLNAEYFRRIDALNYTMMHDDGQQTDDLEEADVVLVGVSRTSKTPTSIYLANRGVKTANVPLVPGVSLSPNVERLSRPLVVGLFRHPRTDRAKSGKTGCSASKWNVRTISISTVRRSPRRSPPRAGCAPSIIGR